MYNFRHNNIIMITLIIIINLLNLHIVNAFSLSPSSEDLFKKAAANMFETDAHSIESMKQTETWLSNQPSDKPKAAHFFLLLPLNCGIMCHRYSPPTSKVACTQLQSIIRALTSIQQNFRKLNHHNRSNSSSSNTNSREYPIVIFHNDATIEQQQLIESSSGVTSKGTPVMWYKINFDNNTLPLYLEKTNIREFYLKYHRDPLYVSTQLPPPQMNLNDITLALPRGHGWGYANMCRLFSGLIMFSRPMQSFQYYWRLDVGDSKLISASIDPFQYMKEKRVSYGYGPLYGEQGCPWNNFQVPTRHNKVVNQLKLKSNSELTIKCPHMTKHAYNNFEVVDMNLFRSDLFLKYFVEWDKSAAFYCGYVTGTPDDCNTQAMNNFKIIKSGDGRFSQYKLPGLRVLGDAEFRGLALAVFGGPPGKQNGNIKLPGIHYAHPVPWASCSKEDNKQK